MNRVLREFFSFRSGSRANPGNSLGKDKIMAYGDGVYWDGTVPQASAQGALTMNFQLDYQSNGSIATENCTFDLTPGHQGEQVAAALRSRWASANGVAAGGTNNRVEFAKIGSFSVVAMRFRVGPCVGVGGSLIPQGAPVQVVPGLVAYNL